MQILTNRSKELLAADVPPGLYMIVKPRIGELVVKLHRHTNPAHYLAKQRWVNLDGTSDMTPETVYPVTIVEKASGPATAADIPAIVEAQKHNHTIPLHLD